MRDDNQNNGVVCAYDVDVHNRIFHGKGREMTNREKFEEVFGFVPDKRLCVAPTMVCDSQNGNCFKCPFNKFWEKEYELPDRCYRKWFYNTIRYSKARSLCRYSVGKSLRHTLSVIYALVALGN